MGNSASAGLPVHGQYSTLTLLPRYL